MCDFRPMARDLGYEQITGITYSKQRDGWYETFNLQASSYGNPFFYFNYGVILPDKFPADRKYLRDSGWYLRGRLRYKNHGAFPCATKAEIEESARYALQAYKEELVPWFAALNLEVIKKKMRETPEA